MECGLKTIAVLAGGLQYIYPPENKILATEILKHGALVPEFHIGVKFTIQNRVISGLSMGIIVTEARSKRGAKIRAAFVLEQNRKVSALQGRFDSSAISGTVSLIVSQQAKLICSAADILEELLLFSASTSQLPFDFETTQSGFKK